VNPTVTFPPPVIVQDAEARIVAGAALSTHIVSAVNPVPLPVTTIPAGPDVGVTVKVPTGPAVTVKDAKAESLAPRFVMTVTV